jgi:hypothetical protein
MDCIKYYQIQHNGRDIGPTLKDKVQLESYLLNVMRPKSDKENKETHLHFGKILILTMFLCVGSI